MKKTILCCLFLLSFVSATFSQTSTGVLQAGTPKSTISRFIYGHFAEHLGRCIYDGFYVGEKNTAIPNTAGVRNDVVAALRKLKVPVLRWPGGCFADTYHWKDGIGPKAKRPKMVNVWWGGVTEDNSFGTHDFLNMCELIGAEPYLAANIGSGTVQDVADWVNYVNFPGESPMTNLRKANGRSKPWNVRFWGVGNEAWGCGGNMKPDYYSDLYRKYATFMSDWSNTSHIFRVASGANSADYNWTETLMKNIPLHMVEGVALHHYSVINWSKKGDAVNYSEDEYFKTMQQALFMDSLVQHHSAIMDKYDPQKKVALVVDEWGGWYDVEKGSNPGFLYQQNTMRDAMIAGTTLNIFNNHSDRVRMANLAQAINVLQAVILTKGNKMILTPTYHVMEMYNVHQDARLLPLTIRSGDYVVSGQKLPAVSGSASVDSLGRTHVSLVNIDAQKEQTVSLQVEGGKYSTLTGRILQSGKLQDYNSFENPAKIQPAVFNGATLAGGALNVKLPPFSVVVLEMK
ncbi:alpha-N-arabinofuranosidase [Flavisolibacter nicotianae]|uniref:alpha-N-arabinofuranosidase n=1 Tax=Flavisolibacter nicotianae TaxID=2364882 RepID=UPI000EAE84E2|nr:alpha-L-arabinofuranosidase C-terminal domain-containing protein [Flavisolibacter nicotianae]